MIEKLVHTIEAHHMILENECVIVAVSGGPDSLALLHALWAEKKRWHVQLVAVHVNHMFRGNAAYEDADFVKMFCKEIDVPIESYEIDVSKEAEKSGESFETAGRRIRYACYEAVRQQYGAQKIAIGQNRNDVIETFLMNLFRGAGLDGLSSTDYVRDNMYIRPLLDIRRDEIETYCLEQGLDPRRDQTNSDVIYTRNRIRNALLPYIRENFNQSIDETLAKTIDLLRMDQAFWKVHCSRLFAQYVRQREDGIFLEDAFRQDLTEFEQLQLLRYVIKIQRGHLENLSQALFRRVLTLNQTGTSVRVDEGLKFRKTYGGFLLEKDETADDVQALPTIYTKIIPSNACNQYVFDDKTVGIDLESVVGKLFIRRRLPGDRFVPLGMRGHKKIKDFFIDQKTPLKERERTWLICDEEKIVWVYGMRINEHCKITKLTKNIMIISLGVIVEKP